jgi:hypothetical protein
LVKPESEWTWVHYKVLEESCDCSPLPELLQEASFIGFPGGDSQIAATSREETEGAVLDLLAVGAIDLFDGDDRLSLDAGATVLGMDSAWDYPRGAEIEVIDNDETMAFLARRPEALNPHRPAE